MRIAQKMSKVKSTEKKKSLQESLPKSTKCSNYRNKNNTCWFRATWTDVLNSILRLMILFYDVMPTIIFIKITEDVKTLKVRPQVIKKTLVILAGNWLFYEWNRKFSGNRMKKFDSHAQFQIETEKAFSSDSHGLMISFKSQLEKAFAIHTVSTLSSTRLDVSRQKS
jgi:hypothetical protein